MIDFFPHLQGADLDVDKLRAELEESVMIWSHQERTTPEAVCIVCCFTKCNIHITDKKYKTILRLKSKFNIYIYIFFNVC